MDNGWKGVPLSLFQVPEVPLYHLERAPLVQALAQVKYPLIASLETMSGIAPLQEALRVDFPYMEVERAQEVSLVIGPAGSAGGAGAASVTWKLTNDSRTLIVIGAGSATLSAGASYKTVADFSSDFRLMLDALASVGVPRCDRLGVRYLSLAAELPGENRSWRRWFKPELLGWVGSDVIADDALETGMSQVTLSHRPIGDLAGSPSEIQATVRHGAVPAQTEVPGIPPLQVADPSYLLDLDVYAVGHQQFEPASILKQFMTFHKQIDRFFHWSLTEEGAKHFGLVHDS